MSIERNEDGFYLCPKCDCRTLTETDYQWHLKAHQMYGTSLPSMSKKGERTIREMRDKYRAYINDIGRSDEKHILSNIKLFGSHSTLYSYGDSEYVELRDKTLRAANYRCEVCLNKSGVQCHHIIPAVAAPHLFYDSKNLVVLCQSCHDKIHRLYNNVRSNYEYKGCSENTYSDYEQWWECEECGRYFYSEYYVCYNCAFKEG